MPKRLKIVLPVIKQTILTFLEIFNIEGHIDCCISSKVTTILLNGLFLITVGIVSGRVCPAACAAGLFKHAKIFNV